MNERQWVALMIELLQPHLKAADSSLSLEQGKKLTYAEEVVAYRDDEAISRNTMPYETDMLVSEHINESEWKPRLVIEAKINSVTTHDAITYSQKAATHKAVHPYLRYGIILGNRAHYPLPGRLFRHGAQFDFMMSFVDFQPTADELEGLAEVVLAEVEASRQLEEVIFNSRSANRERYYLLHRPLNLK